MSHTITHLYVAYFVAEAFPEFTQNKQVFYSGSTAPDVIQGKIDFKIEEKYITHLREGITSSQWFDESKLSVFNDRLKSFVSSYILNQTDQRKIDFNFGYLVHLILDRYNHEFIRTFFKKVLNEEKGCNSPAFYKIMVNDLKALDYQLLEKNSFLDELIEYTIKIPEIEVINDLVDYDLMKKTEEWYKNYYYDSIKNKRPHYLNYELYVLYLDFFIKLIIKDVIHLLDKDKL